MSYARGATHLSFGIGENLVFVLHLVRLNISDEAVDVAVTTTSLMIGLVARASGLSGYA